MNNIQERNLHRPCNSFHLNPKNQSIMNFSLRPSSNKKQFISEFDPSLIPNPNTPSTIAPISNTWLDNDNGNVFTGRSGFRADWGPDEFDGITAENFASALLKGYGWEQEMGVGKTRKVVKVLETKRRPGRSGFGYVDDKPTPPSRDGSVEKTKSRKRGREREEASVKSSSRAWLNSRIRVRVISKELKGGRLYLKKGEIVDVVGPTTCDVVMDEGREIIQGVEQEDLETALPRHGGPVLVLYGRYKGVYGSLQEKDMDRETAFVRHADTHELLNVKLDQIAEYVGDPDDIGY